MATLRTINQAGRSLIESFEGKSAKVYLDPVGKPTVGVGHLLSAAERKAWPVGTVLPDTTIEALLSSDLTTAEKYVATLAKVQLTDNQFAALVSFTFNLGGGALGKSTLLRLLNKGQYEQAADEFAKWNKAGGHVLPGLTRRRAAEKALFLT